ncbi:MAG TPA: AtpZ/AtpI family protein [Dehalococcoidales bacterium]|nr:AtpZ/AtpI family protein [Dehalococcoidales bacterium]
MDKNKQTFRILGLSFFIGISIFGGIVGGLWLDRKLDTQPVFILLGLALGLIVAFGGFYRVVISLLKNNQNNKNKPQRRG